jgi:F0F1-type ATP synthase assembly protein I
MELPLVEMAAATGLDFYDEPGPINSAQGILLGISNGIFLCVGGLGNTNRIAVYARFKGCANTSAMLGALKEDSAMKKMYSGWKADVTPQTVLWSFRKPLRFDQEDFAAATEAFKTTITNFTAPFDLTKCERCGAAVQDPVLANGCPMSMCAACQTRAEEENQAQRKNYESGPSRQARASALGLAAALIGGPVVGLAAYMDNDKWGNYHPTFRIALTTILAFLVVFVVKRGASRTNRATCVMASMLTAIGRILGDILSFGLVIAKNEHIAFNTELMKWTAFHLLRLKWDFSPLLFAFDGLIVLAAAELCWTSRPKFALTFKQFPMPRS